MVLAGVGSALAATGASAQSSAPDATNSPHACVCLTCEPANSNYGVPEAQEIVPRVSGPSALRQQPQPGFYEFETLTGDKAVAYVIPEGSAAVVPASIQRLPSYKALAKTRALERGTSIVFGPDVSESAATPSGQIGTLAYSDCPVGWTCIWEDRDYQDRMLQFSSTGYWQNLGNYGFNDNADSIANKRGGDSLLAEHTGGGGDRYCYDSYSASSNLGGFGDDASSIFLSTADHRC